MRIFGVVKKCFKEQMRSFWLLLLTVSTAPFFVVVYNLITASYVPVYDIEIVNQDQGIALPDDRNINLGDSLMKLCIQKRDQGWRISEASDRSEGEEQLRNRKADLLMILPENFTRSLGKMHGDTLAEPFKLEFTGNITDMNYIISAILAYNFVSEFVTTESGVKPPFNFVETPIGSSANLSDFELAVPGLMIFSIIMLMLTASVAMITEVENKTILRLKMSRINTFELMGGISFIQILVGLIAVILTLGVAAAMGFKFHGSVISVFIVVIVTTISIIAFSLFIAALSKTATQVLIIGNFPLFLFMFFTGSMFPINLKPWFSVSDYGISLISLMSPTHAVSALNKILIMQENFSAIQPELISMCILSVLYFYFGMAAYKYRHMRTG